MKQLPPGMVWGAVVFAAVAGLLCACVLHEPAWGWLRVSHEKPYFADMFAVLAASDARAAGADPYALPNLFDVFGRPHIYGPWWLELGRLGLTRADNGWMGVTLGVLALAAGALWMRPRGPAAAAVAFLALASPSVLLGFERGNNDLVVLVLLTGAGAMMCAGRSRLGWVPQAGAAGLVGLAATLKFYPAAALPMLLARGSVRRAIAVGAATSVALACFAFAYREELARAVSMIPHKVTARGYGLSVVPFLWKSIPDGRGWLTLGTLAGLAPWLWLTWRELRWPIPLGWRGPGFIAGGATWAACYFVSYGYPYRAVLLLLPAGAWLQAAFAGARPERRGARWALALSLILAWLVLSYGAWVQWTGAESGGGLYWLLGLQSGLALGISVYLAWVVARRSWRALTRW